MRSSKQGDDDADQMFGAVGDAPTSKLDQLCVQVGEAIAMALATANNPILNDLSVLGVRPRRGAASLEVMLAAPLRVVAIEAVARAAGYLRGEVAGAILRARVPDLVYVVVEATE